MFNYILYRIGQFIALYLPLKITYGIAVFISDIHYLFADKDRAAVRENLKAIFPEKPEKEIKKIRLAMSRNFAKYLVDFFRFPKISLEYIKRNIKIENAHYYDEALAKGKGVIILSAHLGNWELAGAIVALLGYPLWVVVLPHKHRKVDDFFNHQREDKGVKVIPLGKAVRQCLAALSENKLVALVGDRDFTQGGRITDFFGKPTLLPEGPAVLALKTQAAIVPTFIFKDRDSGLTFRIEKPLEFIPSGDKEKDLKDLITRYKAIIEGYIRKYPEQWYMFRRFWV